jgi:hypothetical protein
MKSKIFQVIGSNLDSVLTPKIFLLSPPTVAGANADEWELISELAACTVTFDKQFDNIR